MNCKCCEFLIAWLSSLSTQGKECDFKQLVNESKHDRCTWFAESLCCFGVTRLAWIADRIAEVTSYSTVLLFRSRLEYLLGVWSNFNHCRTFRRDLHSTWDPRWFSSYTWHGRVTSEAFTRGQKCLSPLRNKYARWHVIDGFFSSLALFIYSVAPQESIIIFKKHNTSIHNISCSQSTNIR